MTDIKVGDHIRLDSHYVNDLWVKGEVLTLHNETRQGVATKMAGGLVLAMTVERGPYGSVVRVQRPTGHTKLQEPKMQADTPTKPVLIDGLTPTQCYTQWCDNRAILERGGQPMYKLTPAQIEAGRAAYQADSLCSWSDELRGLQILSRERERLQVVVDMDVD